ncbi:MAG: urease accessory protein UreF [Pseudomonadota bacterium]
MKVPADAALGAAHLHHLLTWFSPAFPIGAFSYSHGLEWAIGAGEVGSAEALEAWLGDLLRHGAPWTDAVLAAEAYRAAGPRDAERLLTAADLALALSPTKERHLETTAQGGAFARTVSTTLPSPATERLLARGGPIALPVAIGAAARDAGLPLDKTLQAMAHAFCANLVSAAVRLVPLGQTEGVRVLHALAPLCAEQAERAEAASLDDLGSSAFLADIASCHHETQTTRLFRS